MKPTRRRTGSETEAAGLVQDVVLPRSSGLISFRLGDHAPTWCASARVLFRDGDEPGSEVWASWRWACHVRYKKEGDGDGSALRIGYATCSLKR